MNIGTWEAGKKGEIGFWWGWLSGKGRVFEKPRPLINRLNFMLGGKKKVLIANLGAGPVCLIGDFHPRIKVKVISSDLLADEYRKICKELNLNLANKVEKQDMTKLTYKDQVFDIIYCANALDHCLDPYSALEEMMRVCKVGGWIYLRHVAHEGQRHRYKNFHQWNIDMTEDGDSIFWNNKPGSKTDTFWLSEVCPNFKTTIKVWSKVTIVTSFVKKT